ncbi:hypothetical protein GJ496_009708 [Pomphorhynchus laevis]|nr:hypothetical protein GJ496_009708 [Pomphorhynchus laevis]
MTAMKQSDWKLPNFSKRHLIARLSTNGYHSKFCEKAWKKHIREKLSEIVTINCRIGDYTQIAIEKYTLYTERYNRGYNFGKRDTARNTVYLTNG